LKRILKMDNFKRQNRFKIQSVVSASYLVSYKVGREYIEQVIQSRSADLCEHRGDKHITDDVP
jgi:hypothetical protein